MRRIQISAAGLALAGAVFTVAGCGGGESPTDVVNKHHKAIMAGDIDAVMATMCSSADRKKVESALSFRKEMMKKLPEVVGEKIDGDTAKVTCKFGPVKQDVDLVREGGAWKVK